MKLPKQWKYWIQQSGLALESTNYRGAWTQYNFKGKGRHWRINCNGQMQVSCVYDEFDRWANSLSYSSDGVPTTQEEFNLRVKFLLSRAERKERLIDKWCNI